LPSSEEDIAKAPAYLQTVLKGIKQNLDVAGEASFFPIPEPTALKQAQEL